MLICMGINIKVDTCVPCMVDSVFSKTASTLPSAHLERNIHVLHKVV
jgi:hypothetical protein